MNILEHSSSMLWWRAEVVAWRRRRISGSLRLPVCLGEGYDLAACYLRARQDKKAVESPHAVFLNLTQGDHSAAAEFIQRFGLLEWEKPHIIGWREDRSIAATARYFQTHGTVPNLGAISPTKPLWLSLDDFWAEHARYAAVVRLWQALGKDVLSLRKA